ncbi:MAG: Uma2 family endonuclease [Microscillaceae bacterium]|nr:Uma2 family endonuclease [Microscillaceae bacterium]
MNIKILEKIPVTWEERMAFEQEVLTLEGNWEDYWEVVEEAPFKIEYFNKQLILMGQASDTHELIVANIIRLLGNLFYDTEYRVYGSNRLIYVESCAAAFEPDVSVASGNLQSISFQRKDGRNMQANLNPAIVVEILSEGTKTYDLTEKLPCYKTIPSVQQIIYVDQSKPGVSVYSRTPNPHEWLNVDLSDLSKSIVVNKQALLLSDIYKNVGF